MFQQVLQQVAQGLKSLDIPYMVIGGQAVLVYGEPRLTRDVDVTLGVGTEKLPEIIRWVQSCQWKILAESAKEFVAEKMVLPCQDVTSGIRIDLIFSISPYERQAIERARTIRVGSTDIFYASPEDLVLLKIVSGRPRDLDDVRSVILKNPDLDLPFVDRTLAEIDPDMEPEYRSRLRAARSGLA